MRTRPHIAVIGAGIVGAAIAYRLAKSGGRVTVIYHPPRPVDGDRKALARALESDVRAGLAD